MAAPSRGDIYHIEIAHGEAMGHELEGPHWWVVLSITQLNQSLNLFTAVPLSSPNNKNNGKPKDEGDFRFFRIRVLQESKTKDQGRTDAVFNGSSIALTEQTRTFSTARITGQQRLGTVDEKALAAIEGGLLWVIGAGIRRQAVPDLTTTPVISTGRPSMPKEPSKPLPGRPLK